MTATTVGYGDKYPITMGGRIVGVIMLTVGVALFATFSGFLANAFLSSKSGSSAERETTTEGDLRAALDEIERLQAQQQQALAALRARGSELEPG